MPDFDRDAIEAEVQATLAHLADVGIEVLPSLADGVVAFERLHGVRVDWDGVAQELGEVTGLRVVAVADCDWGFEDSHDREATFVAFDVPGLAEGYRDETRNLLSAPAPQPG